MNGSLNIGDFRRRLTECAPDQYPLSRCLSLYSATIAIADEELMALAIDRGVRFGVTRDQFYEVVLQSYLFLGFPRMLQAAEKLALHLPITSSPRKAEISPDAEWGFWLKRGDLLCRQVYGETFESLRTKVQSIAPEIWDWMILEGYGKVLSRPGLDIATRELSIVAFLMVEDRPKQLWSHMQGALNVGVSTAQLKLVIDDLGASVGDGYHSASAILDRIRYS